MEDERTLSDYNIRIDDIFWLEFAFDGVPYCYYQHAAEIARISSEMSQQNKRTDLEASDFFPIQIRIMIKNPAVDF